MPETLCNLSDVKNWLGLTNANDDQLLTTLIANVSQAALSFLRRASLASASYTEKYDGTGTPTLALLNYPITAVSSLTINNMTIQASPDGVVTGYVFDDYTLKLIGLGGAWDLAPAFYGTPENFIKGFQNVAVSYTAGYASVPADISQALVEWCAFRYRARGWIGQKSKHLATGESVTFVDDNGMPEYVKHVLKHYKRRIPV
jgi:hypothetical protein